MIGPISACHVNPAVTLGALLTRRLGIAEAAGYWAAQFAGGIIGVPAGSGPDPPASRSGDETID